MNRRHGLKVVAVKIVRYEIRTIDGRKVRSFATKAGATAWLAGYMKAFDELAPRAAKPTAKVPDDE